MDMPKLLIAEANDDLRQTLVRAAADTCIVRACGSGTQALEMLPAFRPDILAVDLLLPELDGLSLLEQVQSAPLRPSILATTTFLSPYITSTLARLGVDYLLPKPFSEAAFLTHIRDLAALRQPEGLTQADVYAACGNLLLKLGFPSKLDGFCYLQAALPAYAADMSQGITKELYATVGQLYGKEPRQVERSMRTAIEVAWNKRDEALWREYFPAPPGVSVPKPSNGAFLSRMATQLTWILGTCRPTGTAPLLNKPSKKEK